MEDMLVGQDRYLEAGIHIGTKLKTADMVQFIYKSRHDRLYVLDLKRVDDRIRAAAKMIARYEPKEVVSLASRMYAANASYTFSKVCGFTHMPGRFVPGAFTNPARKGFSEPKLLIVSDTKGERQAVREAALIGVPVIALCDTDNSAKFVDLIIPCNNKGKKSLALVYYLLAREVLKARGDIKSNDEFTVSLHDFEEQMPREEPAEEKQEEEKAEEPGEEAEEKKLPVEEQEDAEKTKEAVKTEGPKPEEKAKPEKEVPEKKVAEKAEKAQKK